MTSQEIMQAALKVRGALLSLQKELLEHLKEGFEKENARQVPPGEWLQVIMVSHRYHWLRELTSLIADIDLLTELQEITPEQAGVARSEVERLFFKSESSSEFSKHYRQFMTTGAPFAMTQGLVKEAVQKLPVSKKHGTHEQALEARKAWHEEHKVQSRKRRS
jgi:hypothetical protein